MRIPHPPPGEAAEARVAERNEELASLQTQVEERKRAFPLRARIKEIFKKYGVIVNSILLAAGSRSGLLWARLRML